MTFAKRQLFFISLILSLSMFFAPLAQELYAESLFSKIKTKASELFSNTVEKYTSRDFWVDKATDAITTNILAKPLKLATAALGIAVGTAVGGPVGATLGAYVGNKIGAGICSVVGKPIVKGLINEKLDNGGKLTVSSVFKVVKSLDRTSLACDTTGTVIGDIFGSAIGGIIGAAVTACVGGGTIIPIIGTITFATLGSKYGKKLGTWLGKKIGEKFFNKTYKALTGIDRTEDQSADKSILLSTAQDIASVNKQEVARNTTGEVVGDVIGSVIGTVAGATLSAVTTGGTSEKMATIGEKWGSNIGSKIGKWLGTTFFDKSKEAIDNQAQKLNNNKNNNNNSVSLGGNGTVTISDEIPVASSQAPVMSSEVSYNASEANAAFEAYTISFENYSKALSDPKATNEYRAQMKKEYDACYEMYQKIVTGK